jgi:formiminotetrahydrofolate cyclodeaminase
VTALLEQTDPRAMSLATFAEALASDAPTPGGSSAAAAPAALAAGLVAMVARLTADSDPFGDLACDMEEVAGEADELRAELLGLVSDDADAFERVMAALRLPEGTPEQLALRSLEIDRAYEAAVEPPLRVCTRSLRVLELAVEVAEHGNPNAAADAGVAALLAAASIESAALNVEFDLRPLADEALRASRTAELRAIRAAAASLRESALAAVLGNLV